MLWRDRQPKFTIDITGDFHLDNPNPPDRNPSEEEVIASLDSALARRVNGYIMVGDGVHNNNLEAAHKLAHIYRRYTEQGLPLFVMKGNHDGDDAIQKIYESEGGAQLLDGKVITLRRGWLRGVALIGVSTEYGGKWWEAKDKEQARQQVREEAKPYGAFLDRALRKTHARNLIVVTHRGIIPETVGTAPRDFGEQLSPQVERLSGIIKKASRRRLFTRIMAVHGHDHGDYPWEGGLEGRIGRVPVYNDAAPLRKQHGLPIVRTMHLSLSWNFLTDFCVSSCNEPI